MKLTAEKVADHGRKWAITKMYAPTINNDALTEQIAPVSRRGANGKVAETPLAMAAAVWT